MNANKHARRILNGYGAGYVTESFELAEMMCERMARKEGKELPERYWQREPWKITHTKQMLAARELIDQFGFRAVQQALMATAKGRLVYSLKAPWFPQLVQAEQMKLDKTPVKKDSPSRQKKDALWANAQNETAPIVPNEKYRDFLGYSPATYRACGIVTYLGADGHPFRIPHAQLGKVLGTSSRGVSAIIKTLITCRIITRSDGKYRLMADVRTGKPFVPFSPAETAPPDNPSFSDRCNLLMSES